MNTNPAKKFDSSALLAFSNRMALAADADMLAATIKETLKTYFFIDHCRIATCSDSAYWEIPEENWRNDGHFFRQVLQSSEPVSFNDEYMGTPDGPVPGKTVGIALRPAERNIGVIWLFINEASSFDTKNNQPLMDACFQIGIALEQKITSKSRINALAKEQIAAQLKEIDSYKQQLEGEKLYLQQEVSGGYAYAEIIGSGPEIKNIYDQMSQVAFANSTVLILGETGAGKELIARGIHNASPKKNKLMIKVNCASIPENLIESELFGHEKGSFTGATERRIGKFELAHNSTLFLDEIGEMPLELQVKLLRAIQEREIERIGGRGVIKVNVRIIAATNRDLYKEVQEGNFRNDLYYRLNVFPIIMPPLRNRKDDIPQLVSHFINRFARNTGRKVDRISAGAMKELMAYDWPGNVRELEHLLERSILNAKTGVIKEIHLPNANVKTAKAEAEDSYVKTSLENERDHILFVLKKCKGKIYGKGGAAELLDMHVSTLNSRIRKLGIKKEPIFVVNQA